MKEITIYLDNISWEVVEDRSGAIPLDWWDAEPLKEAEIGDIVRIFPPGEEEYERAWGEIEMITDQEVIINLQEPEWKIEARKRQEAAELKKQETFTQAQERWKTTLGKLGVYACLGKMESPRTLEEIFRTVSGYRTEEEFLLRDSREGEFYEAVEKEASRVGKCVDCPTRIACFLISAISIFEEIRDNMPV